MTFFPMHSPLHPICVVALLQPLGIQGAQSISQPKAAKLGIADSFLEAINQRNETKLSTLISNHAEWRSGDVTGRKQHLLTYFKSLWAGDSHFILSAPGVTKIAMQGPMYISGLGMVTPDEGFQIQVNMDVVMGWSERVTSSKSLTILVKDGSIIFFSGL